MDQRSDARPRLTTVIVVVAVLVIGLVATVLFMFAGRSATVPDLSLMTEDEAVVALADAGFDVGDIFYEVSESVGPGRVVSQSPAAGEKATVRTLVALTLAEPSSESPVPDVVSLAEDAASDRLAGAKFVPVTYEQYSETVAPGIVVSQLPKAGSTWITGREVVISVSRGPAQAGSVAIPELVGTDAALAEHLLDEAELEGYWLYNTVSPETPGLVLAQAPEAGVAVPKGAKVGVWVAGQPLP